MNKFNSIVFTLILFTFTLQLSGNDIKEYELAKVNKSAIDLYLTPFNNSKKEKNKFKYNERIKIFYCNSFFWCKTEGGYVKQYLLQFESSKKELEKNNLIRSLNVKTKSNSKWNQDKLFYRTSVDENVMDILSAIAMQNGSQIIFDKGIESTETMTIKDMSLENAFNLILERNNLEAKWQGNTIIVNNMKNREVKKEFIILKNLNIDKLKILLNRYHIYERIKNKVIFDQEMNAVYVEAEQGMIDDLKKIIMRFETAEKLLRETRIKRTQEDIEYNKLKYMAKKEDAMKDKKKKYGLGAYDDWKMGIAIIPLKYISVSAKQMEFLGKKIQIESLEDTLKGLLGTGYVQGSSAKTRFMDRNITNNKNLADSDLNLRAELAYLKVDSRTNSVIVKDFPDRIEEIKQILKKLDVPAQLVEIEVTIASGTTGFTSQLGLALGGSKTVNGRQYGISTSSSVANNVNSLNSGTNVSLLQPSGALGLSGSMIYSGSKGVINSQLNVMENEGIGKVLSNPKMVTLDNRQATIHSGNTISIPVTTNDKIALESVDAGVSIKAIPHIIKKQNDNDKDIMLDISIESSSLGDTTGNQINKTTNNLNSSVIMKDGETLILGGLFQYTKSDSKGGVPLLKDIPFVGFLFSTKNKLLNKSELVFFITPRVLTSDKIKNMKKANKKYYGDDLVNQKEIFEEKQTKDTIENTPKKNKLYDERIQHIIGVD